MKKLYSPTTLISSLLFLPTFALAIGLEAFPEHWSTESNNPNLSVNIVNDSVVANINQQLPGQTLQSINRHLWNQYGERYVEIKDYNGNGFSDVGVMKGAGHGGSQACYAVYPYNPQTKLFDTKSPLTACNN